VFQVSPWLPCKAPVVVVKPLQAVTAGMHQSLRATRAGRGLQGVKMPSAAVRGREWDLSLPKIINGWLSHLSGRKSGK